MEDDFKNKTDEKNRQEDLSDEMEPLQADGDHQEEAPEVPAEEVMEAADIPAEETLVSEPVQQEAPAEEVPEPAEEIPEPIGAADVEPQPTETMPFVPPMEQDNGNDRNEKLDKAMGAVASKIKSFIATKNGKIALGVIALALVITGLFTSHTICFHKWTDATCTEPETCTKCGRTQGDPLGHDWQEATCTEPKTCARCGETQGEPLGHEVEEWKTTTKATCTSEGEKQGECTRCGEIQTKSIAMKDHEFGDWKTTKEATCTEEGEATRKCKNCDKTETKTIAKKDHTPGEWEIETPATVDGSGVRVKKCTECGEVLERETFELSAEEAFEAFAEGCESPTYEDVARDPDSYDGKNVKFTGEVIQVMQDGDEYTMRVDVTNTGYYWTDTIMVYYVAQPGDSRILEDDIITLYGTMHGMYSYESVLGATITVPIMQAYYVKY